MQKLEQRFIEDKKGFEPDTIAEMRERMDKVRLAFKKDIFGLVEGADGFNEGGENAVDGRMAEEYDYLSGPP